MAPPSSPPRPVPARPAWGVEQYVQGVLAGDRAALGRAITLIESTNPDHEKLADQVLVRLLPHTGGAIRIGITGIPGAGKSTFIEAFGSRLTEQGRRLAVLTVDPSSARTGGSILGDKTRMPRLANDDNAFVRPSPSAGTLGGVARKTRESLALCEAAGFDVVMVETVGVGQSETMVDDMVDFFLVLMVAGAGDELQGIKRGVLELADLVAINKCDGDNVQRAELARREHATALHWMRPKHAGWTPMACTCSALTGFGLSEIWSAVLAHRQALSERGRLDAWRREQAVRWLWSTIEERLKNVFKSHPGVAHLAPGLERAVADGSTTASHAAAELLQAFGRKQH